MNCLVKPATTVNKRPLRAHADGGGKPLCGLQKTIQHWQVDIGPCSCKRCLKKLNSSAKL